MLAQQPGIYVAYYNLGNIAFKQDDFAKATEYLREGLRLKPDQPEMVNVLATCLAKIGQIDEAIIYFSKSLTIEPNSPETHQNIAIALATKGDLKKAAQHFERSLQLDPNSPDIYYNLGRLYSQKGDLEKAIKSWKQGLELRPEWPQVLNNIAWLMTTQKSVRNPEEALGFALQACELTNFEHPVFLDTLGAAYAATGKFDQAIETAQKAINIVTAANQPQMANEIQKRIELYKNKQCYIENAGNPY
jgi:tetratricopeptide (TPR) repeat protein